MMDKYLLNQTTLKIVGLYRSDYRSSYYLREVAREVGVDMKAVQIQLRRLEDMNIVTSIDRGKIKEYRLNLTNSVTRYFVIMAESFYTMTFLARNFLIKKLLAEVENKIQGSLLVFGSFAKGQATRDSDIDLFVFAEKKVDPSTLREAASLLGRKVSTKSASGEQFLEGLDKDDPLVKEVVSNHIVLKGVDGFCDILWRHYAKR